MFRESSSLHVFAVRFWLFGAKHQDRGLACGPTRHSSFLLLDLLLEAVTKKQDRVDVFLSLAWTSLC